MIKANVTICWFFLLGCCLGSNFCWSQPQGNIHHNPTQPVTGGLNNVGYMKIMNGTTVQVNGNVKQEDDNSDLQNEGDLRLRGNWLQTNFNSFYSGDGLLTFNANNQFQIIDANLQVSNIKISNNRALDILGDLTVIDTLDLDLNSQLMLGEYDLFLYPTATIENYDSTHYIHTNGDGSLYWEVANNETKQFPIGLMRYNPATLTNSGTSDIFNVRLEDSIMGPPMGGGMGGPPPPPGSGPSIDSSAAKLTWYISEQDSGGSNITMEILWHMESELPGFSQDSCGITSWLEGDWDTPSYSNANLIGNNQFTRSRSNITVLEAFSIQSRPNLVGIEETEIQEVVEHITLFPNPTEDYIMLRFETPAMLEASIEVFAADGRLLLQKTALTYGVVQLHEVSEYPAGTYFVKITLPTGELITNKFIKSRL